MTDRKQDQPNRAVQQSSHGSHPPDEDLTNTEAAGPSARERSTDERASVADDRTGGDRERRSFSGDREHDELGSEVEHQVGFDESDDELGGSGQSQR